MPRSKGKKRSCVAIAIRIVSAALIIGGLAALVFLNASDLYAQWVAEQNISRVSAVYDDSEDPERLAYKRQAKLYNDWVAGADIQAEILPYAKQLFYEHEPMMSWLEIPKISLRVPIYHGAGEDELMAGAGHLEGTSLPVGGESAHCVLLGHSGMRNTRMFDDLGKLEKGDVLVLHTLNEPYAYRVYRSEVVTPDIASRRTGIKRGRDLVTLVTCTPYGVNSHRLLVHAKRCAYEPDEVGEVGIDTYVNRRNLPLIAAMVMLALTFFAGLAGKLRSRRCARPTERKRKETG